MQSPENTMLIINLLLGIVLAGIAWWVKTIWEMVISQQRQIAELALKIAENYVPRAELQDTFKRIFEKLDEIQRGMKVRS